MFPKKVEMLTWQTWTWFLWPRYICANVAWPSLSQNPKTSRIVARVLQNMLIGIPLLMRTLQFAFHCKLCFHSNLLWELSPEHWKQKSLLWKLIYSEDGSGQVNQLYPLNCFLFLFTPRHFQGYILHVNQLQTDMQILFSTFGGYLVSIHFPMVVTLVWGRLTRSISPFSRTHCSSHLVHS